MLVHSWMLISNYLDLDFSLSYSYIFVHGLDIVHLGILDIGCP